MSQDAAKIGQDTPPNGWVKTMQEATFVKHFGGGPSYFGPPHKQLGGGILFTKLGLCDPYSPATLEGLGWEKIASR